jgi:hypothetical protein
MIAKLILAKISKAVTLTLATEKKSLKKPLKEVEREYPITTSISPV